MGQVISFTSSTTNLQTHKGRPLQNPTENSIPLKSKILLCTGTCKIQVFVTIIVSLGTDFFRIGLNKAVACPLTLLRPYICNGKKILMKVYCDIFKNIFSKTKIMEHFFVPIFFPCPDIKAEF